MEYGSYILQYFIFVSSRNLLIRILEGLKDDPG
jgi:hypothetical protein